MRKTLIISIAAASILSTTAFAAPNSYYTGPGYPPEVAAAEVGAGAVAGTALGVGIYNGWYGGALGASTAAVGAGTAIAAGGVAGVGTVALLDAAVQPCSGFHAVFGANRENCVNGQYVEYVPHRRVIRR
ncbi:MAG: hypothetical protein JO254_04090 [Pseudolabrys sp.]|nr:hypothetical protein [Pseudolabrys sp.]